MDLVARRCVLVLVIAAVGLVGLLRSAEALPAVHGGFGLHTIGQHGSHHGGAGHDDRADVECLQVGHCFPVQLMFGALVIAAEAPARQAWAAPADVHAASLKPEASTPPPRPI